MNHLTSEQLTDFVHGELSPTQDALAHAHLADCGNCRSHYDAEIALGEILRAAAASDERELPPHLKAAVWERIRHEPPTAAARIAAWFRPVVVVPVALALALGGWFAVPHGPNRTVDAAYYFQAYAAQANHTLLSEPSGTQSLETSMVDDGSETAPVVTLAASIDAIR